MKKRIIAIILTSLMVFVMIPEFTFAQAGNRVITGFSELKTSEYTFDGHPTESELTADLPDTIDVYLNGSSSSVPIDVKWECVEDYENTDYYFYSVKPLWDDCYTLSASLDETLSVPWITMFRTAGKVEAIDEVEPEIEGITGEEASEIETIYTEDGESLDVSWIFGESSYAASATDTLKVYNYLTRTLGLNTAAACGVMTNLYAESGMQSNNLENKYNKKYDLTDAEYTKRVDAGKGAFKTKSGESKNFRTDYCGYGLCQWTSLGRRSKMIDLALSKKTSISDTNMQLEFLGSELKNSYPEVWHTLKSVPNNANGAYLAAQHFCLAFEIPKDYVSVAASRAKNAMTGYWQQYSRTTGTVTGNSYLGLCGYTYPKAIKTGKGISCKGYVISNYSITSVKGAILNSSGKEVYSHEAKPGATAYKLGGIDSYMKFSKLSDGTYTYKITAKDKKKTVVASHKFTVSSKNTSSSIRGFTTSSTSSSYVPSEEVTQPTTQPTEQPTEVNQSTEATTSVVNDKLGLRLTDSNYPTSLKKGKGFSIKGYVKSDYKLKSVTVKITKTSGTSKYSKTKATTATSYNVKGLDSYLKFKSLPKGTYYYVITAKDTKESKTLLKKKFTVK